MHMTTAKMRCKILRTIPEKYDTRVPWVLHTDCRNSIEGYLSAEIIDLFLPLNNPAPAPFRQLSPRPRNRFTLSGHQEPPFLLSQHCPILHTNAILKWARQRATTYTPLHHSPTHLDTIRATRILIYMSSTPSLILPLLKVFAT